MAGWVRLLGLVLLWAIGVWASTTTEDSFVGAGASLLFGLSTTQPDSEYGWGIERINAPQAWQTTQGSEDVIVAVIDSGIDRSHPALSGRLWINDDEIPNNGLDDDLNGYIDDLHGWDFQDDDADSLTGSSIYHHGTFVAGLIAALNTKPGISGVAPNVVLMDIRILDSRNRFKHREWPQLTAAVRYAIDNGADVVNLSIFSNALPPNEFHQAIIDAVNAGIVVVGAVGNSSSSVQYPGRYDEVIAISAIDRSNAIASYSNSGPETEFAAPGTDVESILPNGSFGTSSGTSWATAYTSGSIALLLSLRPDLSPEEIKAALRSSAEDLGPNGFDDSFGFGLIDAAAILEIN